MGRRENLGGQGGVDTMPDSTCNEEPQQEIP